MNNRSYKIGTRGIAVFFDTLRWRLTLWIVALLIVLGGALILFVNSLFAVRIPQVIGGILVPTPSVSSGSVKPDVISSPIVASSLQVTATPLAGENIDLHQSQTIVLEEISRISFLSVILFVIVGAFGTYYLARVILEPLHRLGRKVRAVDATSLNYRIDLQGEPGEFTPLVEAFNGMMERLQQAFEQQERFIGDAAHELKTPLATLRTNLQVVQRDPGATTTDYQQMGALFDDTLSRMEMLVNDLLLLARGEREVQLEPLYLQVILEEIARNLMPMAREKQVDLRIEVDDEQAIQGDTLLLSRALSNLIENGIVYNKVGGSVTVKVHSTEDVTTIVVEDTGVGLHPDEQAHLFERFYRTDPSRSHDGGGSGLGLAITAEAVRLHSGRIQVESTIGRGTRFIVELPRAKRGRSLWH